MLFITGLKEFIGSNTGELMNLGFTIAIDMKETMWKIVRVAAILEEIAELAKISLQSLIRSKTRKRSS
jgi:hypothetical protein